MVRGKLDDILRCDITQFDCIVVIDFSMCVPVPYSVNAVAGLYSEYGYEKRLTMLEAEFPGANILLHKLGRLPKALHNFHSSSLFPTGDT